jgi:type IV pilus assembly protein PilQ
MRQFIFAMLAAGMVLALPVRSYCQDQPTEQAAKPPIDITPSGTSDKGQMYSIELRDTDLVDLFRFLAHEYKLNLLVSDTVQGKITATFTNVSLEEALDEIAESQNLLIEKKNNFLRISPNLVTKVFVLRYLEAKTLLGAAGGEAPDAGQAEAAGARTGNIYDLCSSKGKILLGSAPNSIVVVDYPTNVKKVEDYIKAIDQKMTKRVFRMKYLKASELMGINSTAAAPPPGGQ